MRNHDDRHSLFLQILQDLCKFQLEEIINSFGRLIQQKDLRICEEHFCQRRSLLLSSGKIIRMMFQKMGNMTGFRYFFNPALLLFILSAKHFFQIFPNCFFHKKALWILRKHCQ